MLSRFRAAKAAEDGRGAKVTIMTIYSESLANGAIIDMWLDLIDLAAHG